jgi:hypothetical protein
MKSTEITVPKPTTYQLPECTAKAKISRVTVKAPKGSRSSKDSACIHLNVEVQGMERYECCARAVFPFDLEDGSPLRCFIENLLGKKWLENLAGQRVDLNALLSGRDCEIDLIHGKHDDDYDWPMVLVESVRPVPAPVEEPTKGGAVTK